MEPSHGRTMLGPGKDPDLDQELDNKVIPKNFSPEKSIGINHTGKKRHLGDGFSYCRESKNKFLATHQVKKK